MRKNFWRLFIDGLGGFTLLEVSVAIALLSMGIGMVGSGVFQVLDAQRSWQDDVVATKDLRHVGSWFSGDVLNTETTNLVDSAAAVDTVTFTTFDSDIVTYALSAPNLTRDHNGTVTTLTSGASSVEFTLLSDVVTMVLVVDAENGSTETITLNTTLRK